MGPAAAQAWQGLQESAEAVVVRMVARGAGDIIAKSHALPWLPDQPPRTAAGHSAYVAELLTFLQVCGQACMHARECLAVRWQRLHAWHGHMLSTIA